MQKARRTAYANEEPRLFAAALARLGALPSHARSTKKPLVTFDGERRVERNSHAQYKRSVRHKRSSVV